MNMDLQACLVFWFLVFFFREVGGLFFNKTCQISFEFSGLKWRFSATLMYFLVLWFPSVFCFILFQLGIVCLFSTSTKSTCNTTQIDIPNFYQDRLVVLFSRPKRSRKFQELCEKKTTQSSISICHCATADTHSLLTVNQPTGQFRKQTIFALAGLF